MADNQYEENDLDSASVIERAKKRFELCEDYWHNIYKEAEDDIKFCAGDQWPEGIKRRRDAESRPCLTINKTNISVKQVTNDQRQNRPAIKCTPIDDRADIETAKVRQGIIRYIERHSGADAVYDTAFDTAAKGGIGFWRLVTEYSDPLSFDQDILLKRVPNFRSIYLDPSFQEPDGSDANYGFAHTKISRDKFKAEYPNAELSKDDEWGALSDIDGEWVNKDECKLIEYYEKEFKEKELFLLSDGSSLLKEELEEILESLGALPPGVEVIQSRKTLWPEVKWYKIAGNEILDETEIPGGFIPIVVCLGEELFIDGKRTLFGIVRHAKDPQRMYNYWASSETETIAQAPKAPWIVAEGQIEGYEHDWETANIKSHSVLQYKPIDLNGQAVAPPQRNVYEPPVQAITNARMLSADDLKASMGIHDASLGARSNETSGIAIQRRNAQAQTANFHLIDNLTRSIRHTGRIINSWIPTYFDGPRVSLIIGEEGDEEVIKLNQEFKHKGQMVTYRMDVGKYDIDVETGPSFATKRQEAAASMLDLTKSYPNLFPIIGDLMVRALDIPNAQEMAERLKRVAPQGVIEDKNQKPIPPEVQVKLQQMSQMIEQLTEQLNLKSEQINQKTLELESKERIENQKLQTQLQIELAKLGHKDAHLLMKAEIEDIQTRLNLLSINQPIENEQPFENEMAFGGQEAAPVMPQEQQPTGGLPPGNNMGV